MRSRVVMALTVGVITVLGFGLPAAGASAATTQSGAQAATKAPAAAAQLADLVSSTPVSYTPNISGYGSCGSLCKNSTVYSTTVVNGEVIVAGEFSQACSPVPGFAQCPTEATADYLLAFNANTGAIDPNFAPKLTGGPVYSLAAGAGNTVYAGGAFTAVNGTATGGLAALTVDPGQSDDGHLVAGFGAQVTGTVTTLAANGTALYAGGSFSKVDGKSYKGVARLNATTGAVDSTFNFTIGDPISGDALQLNTLSVTPDGSTLAIAGTFLQVNGVSHPRIALISTGGGVGKTATLDTWMAPILANNCSAEHNYVNGLDFSSDGSFFAISTTGYKAGSSPGICDAVARFPTTATGTNVQPTWINYTGGDTYHSIAVVGNVIYAGGHNRWVNNECGNNRVCESNAVLVNGLAALDPNTGLALPWWHPQTLRKTGVQTLVPFNSTQDPGSNGGLIVGTDATTIGGAVHDELAIFPETSTAAQTPGGPIPSGMFSQGRIGGQDESNTGTAEMCVDDPGDSSTPGTAVDFSTCTNGNGQNWGIEPGGTIQINGLCLDTNGGATTSGTGVVLATCDGASTQQWAQGTGNIVTNGGAAGLCLDDPGAKLTNGTKLVVDTCSGASSQVWPLPVAQAPPPPPPVGSVYPDEIQSGTNVPCATSAAKSPKAGVTKVELESCLGYATQNWTLQANGEIQVLGLCLDTVGESASAGTQVDLNTCTGAPTQIWTPQANRELTNGGASGICLDDPASNTANGTDLDIAACSGGNNQQWRLPAV
jgi:Ricin-type beta-trefoil lectin domain/Domain of unknown function (DUF5122) beta-propeller